MDAEMKKLESMDEDDLEALKKRRIEMMKKQQEKKQEWLAQGHGEYSDIPEEKVRCCFTNFDNDFWEQSHCNFHPRVKQTIIEMSQPILHIYMAVQEFFNVTKNSENVVCHFYREETFRCKIMDKHLAILAKKHVETKFCKVNNIHLHPHHHHHHYPNLRLMPRRRLSFAID